MDILESLGYTVRKQQEVSIREPDRERAIQTSLELFLVQVDLQMIKEIIDRFPESEVTLKDVIEARSKQRDIKGAIGYLKVAKVGKRRKVEEPQGDDAPSHRHAKSTQIGRIDNFNNVHSDSTPSDTESSADQTTGRKSKNSILPKGRDDSAADTYDSSSGSTVSKRKPSYYSINSQQLTDHDLYGVSPEGSQRNGATQHNVDAHYRTFGQAGPSCTSKQLNCHSGHSTISQGGSPYDLNQRNLDERHGTFPQSGSSYEAKQHYQDPRHRTVPLTGPSHYSDNAEGSQHYQRVLHTGSPLYPDDTKDKMDSVLTTARHASAARHETVTPLHITSQYSNEHYIGSLRDDQRRHVVVTQSSTVLPSSKVLTDTNGYHSSRSSRTETPVYVSASGDARYGNLQDISGYSGHPFISKESDKRMSTKESARRHEYRDVKYGPAGTSSSEPMEVEQRENSRVSPNDATSVHNGMAEGTYGKTPVQSRVTDLNTTLRQRLTIESSVRLAGEESKQVSNTASEHRRQFDSECVAGAQTTGSRVGTTGGAQPTRLLYSTTSKSGSSAADLKDHSTAKTEPKGSSPGSSRRTSAQQDQTPGTSSYNDPRNEISPERSLPEKGTKAADVCELCGLQGTIICRNCVKIICIKCMEIYATDVCGTTKGQHAFAKLKDVPMPQKISGDSKPYSRLESANINEACRVGDTDWPCSRCTFLNDPEHKICVICGATRGIGDVESTKPGSRVCGKCTLHNEETAERCKACDEPLSKIETLV